MSLTTQQLKVMSFGYLSGADLLQYAAPALLIKQFETDNDLLQNGCNDAYSKIISQLSTRYNVTTELQNTAPVPAQGNVTIDVPSGTVTAIGISYGGVNYSTAPQVVITGGGGTGATAEAVLTNGVVTSVNITNGGTGYTSLPAVSFTGGLSPDPRATELVRITSILAVQFILSSLSNISTALMTLFTNNFKDLKLIRDGQTSLPLNKPPQCNQSIPELAQDSFLTIG